MIGLPSFFLRPCPIVLPGILTLPSIMARTFPRVASLPRIIFFATTCLVAKNRYLVWPLVLIGSWCPPLRAWGWRHPQTMAYHLLPTSHLQTFFYAHEWWCSPKDQPQL